MRAIVITEPGGPEVLQIRELPAPVPAEGEVLIRVRAFGVNHAETYMRKGEWPEATPVSGIEAVGTVAYDPAGALSEGTSVVTIMGGLGRTRALGERRLCRGPGCQRCDGRHVVELDRSCRDPRELRDRVECSAR